MVEPSASRPRTLNQPRLSPWLSAVVICTLRVIPPMSPPLAAAWRTRPDEGACRSLGVPLMVDQSRRWPPLHEVRQARPVQGRRRGSVGARALRGAGELTTAQALSSSPPGQKGPAPITVPGTSVPVLFRLTLLSKYEQRPPTTRFFRFSARFWQDRHLDTRGPRVSDTRTPPSTRALVAWDPDWAHAGSSLHALADQLRRVPLHRPVARHPGRGCRVPDGRHLDHRLIRTAPGPEPWSPTNGAGCYSSGGTASSPIPGDGRFPLEESKTERSLRAPQRAKSRRRPAGGPGRCAHW